MTYGAPASADDPRFTVRSAVGWGTASFGQHPDEYVGSDTDDDHDWRSSDRYLP